MAFGGIEHGLDRVAQFGCAELRHHGGQALRAQARTADLGREIAAEVARVAHVERQHLEQVLPQHAGLGEAHRRQAQAFLPDLGGAGVVAAMGGAADIGVVRAHHRPEQQGALGEDRHEHGHVRQVRAAAIRVVQDVDVVRRRIGEARSQRLRRPGHRAHMHRDVVGLRDQPALRVDQGDREVARGVEDLRVGGAEHRLAHFLGDGGEAGLQHRHGDRIGHAPTVAQTRPQGKIMGERSGGERSRGGSA